MLKLTSIFRRNGAHLIEKKMFEKNKGYSLLRFEYFVYAKIFLICVKL
jgi:hypothetical protein